MCGKKVNTLHLEPGAERLLAAAGGDGSVALWDVRKLGPEAQAVATAVHSHTCQSAFFAPDGVRCAPTRRPNPVPPAARNRLGYQITSGANALRVSGSASVWMHPWFGPRCPRSLEVANGAASVFVMPFATCSLLGECGDTSACPGCRGCARLGMLALAHLPRDTSQVREYHPRCGYPTATSCRTIAKQVGAAGCNHLHEHCALNDPRRSGTHRP